MTGRRELLSAVGLGSLLAVSAATAKPLPGVQPSPPGQRPHYKVFSVPAGDRVEDAFNAVAREGFQYAGAAHRYGDTEFIFVKWVPVDSAGTLS